MLPTADDIRRIFPRARDDYVRAFTANGRLLAQHGLSEPLPLCHFLARIGAETGGLTLVEESGNYSARRLREIWPSRFSEAEARVYAGRPQAILSRAYARRELGNGPEATGDGWRYRGRGPMQTTGKYNYERIGAKLGVDLVARPDLLATDLSLGLKAALIEWSALDLGAICARLGPTHEAVLAVARGINLGDPWSRKQPNGLADQKKAFARGWAHFCKGSTSAIDPAADGILMDGEQGEAVRQLQTMLRRLGYPVGEPDGIYGERTEAAVAAFVAREPDVVARGGGPLPPGQWRVSWGALLLEARAFETDTRAEVTARTLAERGERAVVALGWMRRAAGSALVFLGIGQATDTGAVTLPESFGALREAMEPLASNLSVLMANRWLLGIAAAVGAYALASWIIGRIVARYKSGELIAAEGTRA